MTIQDLDTSSVLSVLKYIIGVLIAFIGGLVLYFRYEIKTVRDELKIERAYIKLEGTKNIEALVNTTNTLNLVLKEGEKTGDNVSKIKEISESTKPMITVNTDRIKDIKSHLYNGN